MKHEELFREIGAVGDDLIEEAGRELPARRRWFVPAACAACAVLAAAGLWLGGPWRQSAGNDTAQLPVLTLDTEKLFDGMGFEGVNAYDISDYRSGAPELSGELPETLPVFENPVPWGTKLTQAEKDAQLARAEELFAAEAEAGVVSVELWSNPRVEFEPALPLPEEYRGAEYSPETMQALGEYLLRTYPRWFSWMETPVVSVCGGNYNFDGEQHYTLYVYDAGQDVTDSLMGSAYRTMRLCLNKAGELYIIWIEWPDLSQVIGEYPIISAAQAQELLLNGNYVTSVPYEVSGPDAVCRSELCYRSDYSEIWVPYYRFWVEVPAYAPVEKLGLHTYGAYYVPAVESQYIANMPTYDGSFN